MRAFIFLLILLALVYADDTFDGIYFEEINEEEYGCVVPRGGNRCCWIKQKNQNCCNPHHKKCPYENSSFCCKKKIVMRDDALYQFFAN